MDNEASPPRPIKRRRKYSREFKQQIIAESRQAGASLAAVAVQHGLNPNMVHKWRKALEQASQDQFVRLPAPETGTHALRSAPTVADSARTPAPSPDTIRLEVHTPRGHIVVYWPVSQLPQSITWLRGLMQ